jgi:hypothetical protein
VERVQADPDHPWSAELSTRRATARMRAVLLELGRRPLGLRIWSHFPVELRHGTNGPRRADVTAAEASGEDSPGRRRSAKRKEAATGVQMTTTWIQEQR